MRRRPVRNALRANLGGHQPLGTRPVTHQHELPRPQLGDAEPAQRFHVHEDVGRPLAAGQKTEAAQTRVACPENIGE